MGRLPETCLSEYIACFLLRKTTGLELCLDNLIPNFARLLGIVALSLREDTENPWNGLNFHEAPYTYWKRSKESLTQNVLLRILNSSVGA